MKHIAVIGGGITGVTTAYALAQQGFSVTLYERHRYAGMETSYANGGQLSASNAEVWNHWSTLVKGMKWMLRRDAPLLFHPKASWHQWSWLAEFVAQLPHYEANTIHTAQLAIAARDYLFSWAQQENIDFDLKREGILHIYRDQASYKHAAKVSALLKKGGLERRAVTPEEMRQIEPTLHGSFYGGFFTESDSTGDIHKFTFGLSQALQRMGVQTIYDCDVTRVSTTGERVQIVFDNDCANSRCRGGLLRGTQPLIGGATRRPCQRLSGQRLFHHSAFRRCTQPSQCAASEFAGRRDQIGHQPFGLEPVSRGRNRRVQWVQQGYPGRSHSALGGLGGAVLSGHQHPSIHALGGFASDDAEYAAQSRTG
jgi:hypothetical protein